jgi:hypothetical protein
MLPRDRAASSMRDSGGNGGERPGPLRPVDWTSPSSGQCRKGITYWSLSFVKYPFVVIGHPLGCLVITHYIGELVVSQQVVVEILDPG